MLFPYNHAVTGLHGLQSLQKAHLRQLKDMEVCVVMDLCMARVQLAIKPLEGQLCFCFFKYLA